MKRILGSCSVFLLLIAVLVLAAAPVMAADPVYGGTLVYGRGGDSKGLDPANVTDGESMKVTDQIYDTLVQYQKANTNLRPSLAESWETSADGKTWTFHLRKGVEFQDGTKFNADAVVFNFLRWMDENHPYHQGNFGYYGYMFGGFPGVIQSVKALDRYTVQIELNQVLAPFLWNLAMSPFSIASPTAIQKYGEDYFKHPVGTGPFKFVEWRKDDRIVLDVNEDYWAGRAYLDRIIFRSIPDNAARFFELQAGTIDIMDGLNPQDLPAALDMSEIRVYMRPSFNIGYLAMNTQKAPFDNVLVRRAVNYAVNKKAIVEAFYGELGQVAVNPLPPSLWGYNDTIKDYDHDPAKAKQLLREAGFPDGLKTRLWYMPVPRPYFPEAKLIAEAMQADLAEVGIDVELVTYDWATYLDKTGVGEHEMAMLGWTGDNGDPDNFIYVLLDKDNAKGPDAGNISFYVNDELHKLLVEAQLTMDVDKRAQLYKEAEVIIHDDAPWVPVVHSQVPIPARWNVRGFVPHPTGSESLYGVYKLK